MGEGRTAARRIASASDRVRRLFGGIKVYALVGKSGTGKSFRAKLVAENYNIEYIIDDGLLIHGNSIVAGRSAKRERVYISAIRAALFDDQLHRNEVVNAVKSRKIKKILILGTSERMVARTAKQLSLPPPAKTIFIEEISSESDIQAAQKSRDEEGKHVIPVPSIEVERDHPQLISNSIKILYKIGWGFGIGKRIKRRHMIYEKSVVQPSFHGQERGKVSISEKALGQMIAHCVDEFDGKLIVKKVRIKPVNGVYHIRTELETPFAHTLTSDLLDLRDYTVKRIERFAGIMIAEFNLVIAGVSTKDGKWVDEDNETPTIQSDPSPKK